MCYWPERLNRMIAEGLLDEESIMKRLDERSFHNDSDLNRRLERTFFMINNLTEDDLFSLLQSGTAKELPRQVGHILYNSIAYLSQVPFVDERRDIPASLSIGQVKRALFWLLFDYPNYATETRNWESHARLLFLSMATGGYTSNPYHIEDDEDMAFQYILDVMYETQPTPVWIVQIPRSAFTSLAQNLVQPIHLRSFGIPRERFVELVHVLLAHQTEPACVSNLDTAVDAVANACCHEGDVVFWPLAQHILSKALVSILSHSIFKTSI